MVGALHTNCCVIRQFIDHPTMAREYRANTTARYSHSLVVPDIADFTGTFLIGRRRTKVLLEQIGARPVLSESSQLSP